MRGENMKKILIAGALSAIAQETARCFAADGAAFFLAARDPGRLAVLAQDLKTRGADRVETLALDLNHEGQHPALLQKADAFLGGVEIALLAYGTLPDQAACEKDFAQARLAFETNFVSAASLLNNLGHYFETRKQGVIAVIGSVAGDRGRSSNYVYGAAKGALALFAQGLRARLQRSGVHVLTVKPGFVESPMTAGISKNFLFADARSVGQGIYRAILAKKDIVYLPWFWRWIMLVIRLIPEGIFKRMQL